MLKADLLTCAYGNNPILDQISVELIPGEVLVLIGPNGAGKTTLMRALSRLLKPTAGQVLLADEDIWKQKPRDVAQRLALAVQQEQRDWALTLEEAVSLGRSPYKGWTGRMDATDQNIVEEAMAQMGVQELRDREITSLSGGEWRRMILARVLTQQPEILLLDEPTSGLDLKYQYEILTLVRQLAHEKQLTIALTLHDLNQAALYADRIALISKRNIVAIGKPDEVLTPAIIEQAYEVEVQVLRHPEHQTPLVVPLGTRSR
ncbi:putative siderophore transport system ATP-binding protein YusV [Polystyrenella longa]|uniref:Putative siderophore transport system ATP-binding protein YusV n=1 Tax=Polystyrenella longa TaxID=2528007 RepID=A0A518CQH1_9PLAN|nr:ABC transporter ATP-binding protein [Polystyrenella longa]QDU81463.1 putative siderophore transport system ATP-binding protein YusV [Polystyrenella longa]